jgi:hypothetical protein
MMNDGPDLAHSMIGMELGHIGLKFGLRAILSAAVFAVVVAGFFFYFSFLFPIIFQKIYTEIKNFKTIPVKRAVGYQFKTIPRLKKNIMVYIFEKS